MSPAPTKPLEEIMTKAVTLKDLRETFYKCRDFELTHLWQRSIVLTAFVLLCFTGYGNILMKVLETCSIKIEVLHEIAAGIALIGIIVSIIWIMMAKSSKAWYEIYENVICKIEEEMELRIHPDYVMGEFVELGSTKCDSNLLSCNAGKYSPSKLNIFIGIVLLIIWIVIFAVHILLIKCLYIDSSHVFYMLIGACGVVLFTAMFNMWAKSSTLD
ncbi:hypothetical protein FACS189462_1250 [Spirochaetia bacterium]|nr:hypothetical protein FACS189462_1250 [Spirochaetia bacterium]